MPKIVCPERPCARCKTADREISSYCYPCHNLNGREAAAKKGGYRSEHLFRKYGITGEEADAWVAELHDLAAKGEFFFSLNRYLFVARKPEV